ncbi:MAG: OmpH family outer membrane protein [Candidatus Cardinium sp.]
MNYKFLATWALFICMGTSVKANGPPKVTEQPQVASSSLRVGYVDMVYILASYGEAKKNTSEIHIFHNQLDNQLQAKFKEYQAAVNTLQQQGDTLTEAQKKQKYMEAYNLEVAVRELEEQKNAKMAEKYKTLMQPLHDKIQAVIQEIATEYAYDFVLNKNTDAGPVVFFAREAFNLSQLVLIKLNKMAPKEAQPPAVGLKAQAPTKVAKPSVKKK